MLRLKTWNVGLLGGAELAVEGPGVAVARHREERGHRQWVGFIRVRVSILGRYGNV